MTLCTFFLVTFFTRKRFEVLGNRRNTKPGKAEVTVEKTSNRAGGPHFFGFQPPKNFVGSLPPSARWSRALGFPRRDAANNL
jgi:hypothetical protein